MKEGDASTLRRMMASENREDIVLGIYILSDNSQMIDVNKGKFVKVIKDARQKALNVQVRDGNGNLVNKNYNNTKSKDIEDVTVKELVSRFDAVQKRYNLNKIEAKIKRKYKPLKRKKK
jgi:hypothetical protein